ncbi:hypothetical protein ACWNS2_07830 [Planococcus plakortidis]
MLKKSIITALTIAIAFWLREYFSTGNIRWISSVLFAMIIFAFYFLWEWAKEPYDWHKKKR